MRYLICDKCNGFYELGEDESIFSFDSCECGGKLRYAHSKEEIDKINNLLSKSNNSDIEKFKKTELKHDNGISNKIIINLFGFLIGIIIIFLAESFINNHQNYIYLLFCVLGGLLATFTIGGKFKYGALYGLLVGLIGATLSMFYLGKNPSYEGLLGIMNLSAYTLGYSLLSMLFSLIGGLIGIFFKNYLNR